MSGYASTARSEGSPQVRYNRLGLPMPLQSPKDSLLFRARNLHVQVPGIISL